MSLVPETWLAELVGVKLPTEGGEVAVRGRRLVMRGGVLRAAGQASAAQQQTEKAFGYLWGRRETYDTQAGLRRVREWLVERYGDLSQAAWWREHGERPLLLDAGCGGGVSALELFDGMFERMRYVGADISEAVDVARARFVERGTPGAFLQADLTDLPIPPESVDLVFSEGVLHHTDSTERALYAVARYLKPGGRILFYVYRRKGPIREFTDDYIRERLQAMSADEAWAALAPLTRLGIALGELNIEVEVPEHIALLEIPAGRINLQRLFYWHVFKAFHHPDLSFDEANNINFDWYFPRNAHRQSLTEVKSWCDTAGLSVEREVEEPAGITIIARKLR